MTKGYGHAWTLSWVEQIAEPWHLHLAKVLPVNGLGVPVAGGGSVPTPPLA